MRLSYDPTADALAVELVPDGTSHRMQKLGPGVNADWDEHGRLITIEILNASERYPLAELTALGTGEDWLSLAEAAIESGLSATTLRLQLNAGRLTGQKRGRDWVVSRSELLNYLESRAPSGRPGAIARFSLVGDGHAATAFTKLGRAPEFSGVAVRRKRAKKRVKKKRRSRASAA